MFLRVNNPVVVRSVLHMSMEMERKLFVMLHLKVAIKLGTTGLPSQYSFTMITFKSFLISLCPSLNYSLVGKYRFSKFFNEQVKTFFTLTCIALLLPLP